MSIRPKRNYVLVQPALGSGLLYTPETRYPISGFIYATHPADRNGYSIGDFVVFEEHGITQPNLLQDTFFIRVRDEAGLHIIRADIDVEPVLKETVEKAQRRGDDRWITVHDIDREHEPVRFLASEVVDFGIGSYTESGYRLDYVHHTELSPYDTGLNHPHLISVPENEILFFIPRHSLSKEESL
jgi:hypothetical protein